MTFKQWIIELFKDERGYISIKPVISFIGCVFLCVTMFVNAVIAKGLNVDETLVNAVMMITSISLGADTFDKFSFKQRYDEPQNNTQQNNVEQINDPVDVR